MEIKIPNYCVHNKNKIKGFFGEYRWLSNFWYTDVFYEGRKFPSVEHAYQFAKLDSSYDCEKNIIHEEIIELRPGGVKAWAKTIEVRPDWREVNLDIMAGLVFQKFLNRKDLRQKLIDTNDAYLQELNAWKDDFFGVYVATGKGLNHLGKILMQVRNFWQWTEKKKSGMHFYKEEEYDRTKNLCGLNFPPASHDQSGRTI